MNGNTIFYFFTNMLYSVGIFISALFITWWLLTAVDFLYPIFYHWLDIGSTISEFGPQNRYKDGFELTSYQQHVDYFARIVTAINNEGRGLSAISYPVDGHEVALLRDAEVRHLQDVADLLSGLFTVAWCVMALSLVLICAKWQYKSDIPDIKSQLKKLCILVLSAVVLCAAIGFKTVFYWLHDVTFPQENDWFFYYQDSLMTTMMQAPTLFAPISALFVIVVFLVFYLLNLLISFSVRWSSNKWKHRQ